MAGQQLTHTWCDIKCRLISLIIFRFSYAKPALSKAHLASWTLEQPELWHCSEKFNRELVHTTDKVGQLSKGVSPTSVWLSRPVGALLAECMPQQILQEGRLSQSPHKVLQTLLPSLIARAPLRTTGLQLLQLGRRLAYLIRLAIWLSWNLLAAGVNLLTTCHLYFAVQQCKTLTFVWDPE